MLFYSPVLAAIGFAIIGLYLLEKSITATAVTYYSYKWDKEHKKNFKK